jgi:anti-anti-sigma regulatory factor
MTLRVFGPAVKQFPEKVNLKQGRYFLSDLQSLMNIDRPYIVLDFSNVCRMDRPAVNLLLCCLEEALKRNGDIKLAAVPEEARLVLRLTGAERLFEIFDTIAEAASSFRQLPLGAVTHVDESGSTCRTSAHAA